MAPLTPTSTHNEKADLEAVVEGEHAQNQLLLAHGMTSDDIDFLNGFTPEQKRKVIWKIDWRLMPMVMLLFLVAYLDKANIGNAKIEGLLEDLNMDGDDYSITLSLYFIPYILGEIPSNIILYKFKKPSQYMAIIVTIWGICMTMAGIVNNFGQLIATRLLIGLFEAGLSPGAVFIISKWYLPRETQTRVAILFTSASLGGAFSGLLAFAIAKMDGIAGYSGWRWIFLIEGIFTVLVGVGTYFLLIDAPEYSSWLTEDEKRYLILRQEAQRITNSEGYREKHLDKNSVLDVLKEWKVYLLLICSWGNVAPNFGMKFSMPTIIKGMGFTSSMAQLMTVPPYVCGAIASLTFSVWADRINWRMPFVAGPCTIVVIGFSILLAKGKDIVANLGVCYFAVCLTCIGMYPIHPGVQTWNVNNSAGAGKRAVAIAFLIGFGNIGGIFGSYIYKDSEADKGYPTGYGASMAFGAAGVVSAFVLEYFLWRSNKRRASMTETEVREKYTEEELQRLGDRSPLFKYTL